LTPGFSDRSPPVRSLVNGTNNCLVSSIHLTKSRAP
jgi:hypothetical protein